MILINSLRCDLELILPTKYIGPLINIDIRLAFFCALGLRNGLSLTEVGYKFRSRNYRAKIG
jgi:hypothetical protein